MVNVKNNYNAYQNKGGKVYLCPNHHFLLMLHITMKSLGNFWLKFTSMVTFLPQNPMVGYKVFTKLQGMQPTKTLFLVKKTFHFK